MPAAAASPPALGPSEAQQRREGTVGRIAPPAPCEGAAQPAPHQGQQLAASRYPVAARHGAANNGQPTWEDFIEPLDDLPVSAADMAARIRPGVGTMISPNTRGYELGMPQRSPMPPYGLPRAPSMQLPYDPIQDNAEDIFEVTRSTMNAINYVPESRFQK